jgi:hypothetical protein
MRNIVIAVAVFLTVIFAGLSSPALAGTKSSIKCGINAAAGAASSDCSTAPKPATDFTDLVAKIINVMSVLVGAIAVVMIVIAGFRFVTSAGNETAVAAARKTILYAVIGLLVVAFAQALVHFVLKKVT